MVSLKLIELQVAVPRTQDIGKIQEQIEQRGQLSQEQLTVGMQKKDERKRKQVNNNEKNDRATLTLKQTSHMHESQEEPEMVEDEDEYKQNHPYKGKFIDFSG